MPWIGTSETQTITSDAASGQTLATIYPMEGSSRLWLGVQNTSDSTGTANALDAFLLQAKPHKEASAWHTLAGAASDYMDTMQEPLLGCDADMTTLAKSTEGLLLMDVRGLYSLRLQASASDGTESDATVIARWQMR